MIVKSAKKANMDKKKAPPSPVVKKTKVAVKKETVSKPKPATSIDAVKAIDGIDALFKLHKIKSEGKPVKGKKGKKKKRSLFEVEYEHIYLQITAIKVPPSAESHVVKITLPNSCLPEIRDVCLIVKDLTKGIKEDHEPTVSHFKEMLAAHGVGKDLVSHVMALREIRVEHDQFEQRTALCRRFDAFLADSRIMCYLPPLLGKAFYRRKKFPIAVNMKAKNLKSEMEKALRVTTLPLTYHGSCSMVQIGHMNMDKGDVLENLLTVVEALDKRFPGGFNNVRSLHVKSGPSLAIPIHISTASANDVGSVKPTVTFNKKKPVTDELSTIPGAQVTVWPDGSVTVKRGINSDAESNPDEDKEAMEEDDVQPTTQKQPKKKMLKRKPSKPAEKDTDAQRKRTKVAAKPETAASVPAAAAAASDLESDADSEEEEMIKSESNYLRRFADLSNDQAQEDDQVDDEPQSSDEESVFDDDQLLDASQHIVDSDSDDDDDDDDDEESDEEGLNLAVKPISDEDEDESSKPPSSKRPGKATKKERRQLAKLKKKGNPKAKKMKKTASKKK